jgi:UDP-glucose 4-epimerase
MAERILVVGANGFIGSAILAGLHAAGHRTRALCRREPSLATEWARMGTTASAGELASALDGITNVIWAAGASTPASSAHRPAHEIDGNLAPLVRLLEACGTSQPVRLVYLSTGGAIYGDVEGLATEAMTTEPKSYYSAGKAAAEAFLSAWSHVGRHDVTILRPSNVYGPGQPYRRGFGILPTAFNAILSSEPMVIRGDGEAIRDYLYIDDLVALCLRILSTDVRTQCRTFNASTSVGVSLNGLLGIVQEATGQPVPHRMEPATLFDVKRIVPDNRAATEAFGWLPATPLHDGIRNAWDAFR